MSEIKDVIILAIETSCDETSAAVVKNGREVLSNIISSQIDIHKRFGGVVPEVASRNHITAITNVVDEALIVAGIKQEELTAVAVTYGAGLVGALLVGVSFAKAYAYALNIPLIKVSHIKGHIAANYIAYKEFTPPHMCLVVSGGHTAILKIEDYINHKYLGGTLDDAVGEAFDKVARALGLAYPGGPNIDRLAKLGEANIIFTKKSELKNPYDISYSGLKTAVINYINTKKQKGEEININDICASFQSQAINTLAEKCIRACKSYKTDKLCVAGGVAANSYLRQKLQKECDLNNIKLYIPPMILCTDNAAMIGSAGYFNYINNEGTGNLDLNAVSTIKL